MKNNSMEAGEHGLNESNKSSNHSSGLQYLMGRRAVVIALSFVGIVVVCLVLLNSATPFKFPPTSYYYYHHFSSGSSPSTSLQGKDILKSVLKNASMEDKTIILTTLNQAWAEPDSMLDVFLRSFHVGNQTQRLLNHLIIVTLDQKAYARCLDLHPHCYKLETEGINFSSEAYFMSSEYLKMMWRRIEFLASVLELGYNFVFTDVDIMWLQNPFHQFYPDGDFQIACDFFMGNSYDIENKPNGGFNYVKSNPKTIKFYRFWYNSRLIYPGLHDQDVLNKIKYDPFLQKIGVQIRYLDTAYFGGFCQPSKDFNLVCTMHANCCIGQENKVHDLKILLQDWEKFFSLSPSDKASQTSSWTVPQDCITSFDHPKSHKDTQEGSHN